MFGRDSDNSNSNNNDDSLGSKIGGFVGKAFGGDNNNRGSKDNSS